ncbi:DNA circularization protein [Symbiopectobacterium purcellii]|uniref:DNA circularization N-terminal domain-containing protein n=1 Tax=Symbiopectobacterium purcellii TaxID=2871826 RepID=A0ABX9AQB0_9ENTR|nr:DNA circularization N-terminal domain-containing protein [Symbiopectobacterium purcellii]QZN97360.1 DNA circularization N-terminal domain-containing protein [Symbiopectobacterium purcellii]
MSVIPSLQSLVSTGGDSWDWTKNLQKASFRGVPFAVISADGSFGRRQAVHEYPYRDVPWIEDMGRSNRKITLRGFIVQSSKLYTASDVFKQRDSLIAACETGEAGTLVHPTLGEIIVSIPAGGLRLSESMEQGRMFSFTLSVIESGAKRFAITDAAKAKSSVTESWASVISKTATTYIATVKGALRTVTQAIKTIKATLSYWINSVTSLSNEVTNLGNVLSSTFGSERYGRYNSGSVGGNTSGVAATSTTEGDTTDYDGLVANKMATVVQDRAVIAATISALLATEEIDSLTDNTQQTIAAVMAAVPNVADLLRVFERLSATTDTTLYGDDQDTAIQTATLNYLNITCAATMAYVASTYTPTSRDDATAVLSRVSTALDVAAVTAADAGYIEVYQALLVLRTDITDVMRAAGADLAEVKTVTLPHPIPALTLSNQLYQDASRAGSLIKSANPVHPAFMPTTLKALTS